MQATHFCRLPRERKVVSHKLTTFEDKNYNDKSSLLHLVNYRHHLQRTNCSHSIDPLQHPLLADKATFLVVPALRVVIDRSAIRRMAWLWRERAVRRAGRLGWAGSWR